MRSSSHRCTSLAKIARASTEMGDISFSQSGGVKRRRTNKESILLVMFCLPKVVFLPLVESVAIQRWVASSIVPRQCCDPASTDLLFLGDGPELAISIDRGSECHFADLQLCGAASEAACICEIEDPLVSLSDSPGKERNPGYHLGFQRTPFFPLIVALRTFFLGFPVWRS